MEFAGTNVKRLWRLTCTIEVVAHSFGGMSMAKQPSEQPSAGSKPSSQKDRAPEQQRPNQEHVRGSGSMDEPSKSSGVQRQPGRMPLPD
jgi:hypothetical protein